MSSPPVLAAGERRGLHHKLYGWVLHWSAHRHATPALFALAFVESSVFPVPPDVLLIAMTLARPERVLRFWIAASLGSVLGGIAGYGIGWGLWQVVDDFFYRWVPGFSPEVYQRVAGLYERWNFWVVFTAGFTPLPYKVFTIAGGVARIGFPLFVLASLISRSARFLLVAGLVARYGPRMQRLIERYLGWLTLAFVALLLLGFWLVGLLGGH